MRLLASEALVLLPACDREPDVTDEPFVEVGTDPGNRAPPLVGWLPDGEEFRLADRPGAPTVLLFYRGASCGLCRLHLEQAQRNLSAYEHQGATVLGITLDPIETSAALLEEAGLGYQLVSVGREVFDTWGVTVAGTENALPATFLVDASGRIRFRHVGRNAADRPTDAEIITVLQTIRD